MTWLKTPKITGELIRPRLLLPRPRLIPHSPPSKARLLLPPPPSLKARNRKRNTATASAGSPTDSSTALISLPANAQNADIEIQATIDEKVKTNPRLREGVIGAQNRAKTEGEAKKQPSSPPAAAADGAPKPASWYVPSFSTSLTDYRLKTCCVLDGGSSIHVCHGLSLLTRTRIAGEDACLIAGTTTFKIEAFGTAQIMLTNQGQETPVQLLEVAYVSGFMTNLVSLLILMDEGVFWDGIDSKLIHWKDRSTVCDVLRVDNHFVLEDNNPTPNPAFALSQQEV